MAKEEKASDKCEMRLFLCLLEDQFEEGSSENHQGKTSYHTCNTMQCRVVLIIIAVLIGRH